MSSLLLLADFGSTWTKVTAVDRDTASVVGTAAAFTTIQTGIEEGFQKAKAQLMKTVPGVEDAPMKACSSAAGGLRMMVSGLVPELTAEAARLAALGAGAKVIEVFAHEMTDDDLELIQAEKPEIFLLTGGTDGGNKDCIIANAEALAEIKPEFPIVVAGNRAANRPIKKILDGFEYFICPNVMPKLGEINIKEVQDKIREIFLQEIIRAKGLTEVQGMIDEILMPTPSAILQAMKLFSEGTSNELGIGELVGIDLGGATTDIYSIADGLPRGLDTVLKGIPEPHDKRTVEGDLGMRYSLKGILEAAGVEEIAELAGIPEDRVLELTDDLAEHTDKLPETEELHRLDDALAMAAVETAVRRHSGTLEEHYGPMGQVFLQQGKDLREVTNLVVTGGALVRVPNTKEIVSHCLYRDNEPQYLKPRQADVYVDRRYIMSAMGVLAESDPDLALTIMKKEIIHE